MNAISPSKAVTPPPATLPRKALIIKFGQIGDVIMAIPAARALYELGFAIHWVSGKAVYPLLQSYSWINPILVDDRAILRGSLTGRAAAVLYFWKKVLFTKYDLCATLYYDGRFRILAWPIRAARKIQLSRTTREKMLIPGRHHTDELVRLLLEKPDDCLPTSTPPVPPDITVPSPLPVKTASHRIVLVPGGTSNVLGEQLLRRWPVEAYVKLAEILLQRGWEVVLSGGLEDEWVRPYFKTLPVTDCIATSTLPQVISLFNSCDAVITHDTGPLHMAGLSTACVIGIFGPTDPATRIPRRPFAIGIWGGEGFACRPCYDGATFAPCQVNECIRQILPSMVLTELDRLLVGRSSGSVTSWKIVLPHEI